MMTTGDLLKCEKKTDTATLYRIEYRSVEAVLSEAKSKKLTNTLKIISKDTSDLENKILVIHYYHGKDPCNPRGLGTNGSYWTPLVKILEKRPDVKQYFIYKPEQKTHGFQKKSALEDQNELIASVFFPSHYNCGSFAILWPDRSYIVCKGEYPADAILRYLNAKK
ncbi:hypothetical protein HUK80_11520 [Flavobacterium sp. MAH-1]|uniref:Uncharacterized protein n=1 Tax=Flavobacterium agri TaxID=2743471 RepID=A0A7Y9C7L5_9FLAO|nr:hypothetical protein [Flavobacterium agri]NUY81529.1 hypothetical protein [Flavobacterium agri]NYA71553.1 hypothetical protein [Flavobacterium agri]